MTTIFNYKFKDPLLLERALTHTSFSSDNYERLEFLGDSILNICITVLLFKRHPNAQEGELTQKRAALVNGQFLAELAISKDLYKMIKVGPSGELDKAYLSNPVLCDVFEAVIAAIFLDSSFDQTMTVISDLFGFYVENPPASKNFKGELQTIIWKRYKKNPKYRIINIEGPEHLQTFRARVRVDNVILGDALGSSKKEAEQNAAKEALCLLTLDQ